MEERETLFDYLGWADDTPEKVAEACFKVFSTTHVDDWERFKEAVNRYD